MYFRFMDDVTCGRSKPLPYGDVWKAEPLTYTIPLYIGVAIPGRSLMSINALFRIVNYILQPYNLWAKRVDRFEKKFVGNC